ncbi:MAG: transporter [Pseudomonadota bacterium]
MTTSRCTTSCLLLAAYAICSTALAQETTVVEQLRSQIQEREAEISKLRQQLEQLHSQRSPATSSPASKTAAAPSPLAAEKNPVNSAKEEEELATALESSLVRQGGAVLSSGTIEIEPELSYFYDEPTTGSRRDAFGTALSVRFGLPAAIQADVYVPYVVRDRQADLGSSSGIGDIRLGLTKQLVQERMGRPTLLVFGRWRTTTGDINRTLPTGFGQHAIQVGFTATKRMDPVLLLGSLSYTANLGTAHLSNGARIEAGNVFGGRLGANLAATPDTSFYWGVSYDSSSADRFNGERVELTDRARGFVELGSTTVIGRGRFFNLGIALGVTPAAPRFSIAASVPFRF